MVLLFAGTCGFSADKGFLYFTAKVVNNENLNELYSAKVFRQNQEVTSFNIRQDGLFSVYLELFSVYEIKISSSSSREACIRLSTLLPSGSPDSKYDLTCEIQLQKRTDKTTSPLMYVWYSKDEKKFVLTSTVPVQLPGETRLPKNTQPRDPKDPEKITSSSEKNALAAQQEAEKKRAEVLKNNQSVKAEASASLSRTIAESEKKKKADQRNETCNEERKEEDKYKKVTSVLLCNGNSRVRLRKVEYTWGSSYYYKNGLQVSEREFEKEFSKIKQQAK